MYQVLVGDNRETLKTLPDKSVHMVATSPPYWGLRDYGHADQIGLEESPEQYVATMVEVFREVRRVLRDDGTLWLNLGDSYFANTKNDRNGLSSKTGFSCTATKDGYERPKSVVSAGDLPIKPKDLVGIPWRVAFALQADGWYLRQDIIWSKPNPMPESVRDRCTKAHEYIFLLAKSARYYYDADAVKEAANPDYKSRYAAPFNVGAKESVGAGRPGNAANTPGIKTFTGDRNRRSVWTVATSAFKEAHFATWPPRLVEPMILAGTSEKGCCPTCGAQWVRVVEREQLKRTRPNDYTKRTGEDGTGNSCANSVAGVRAVTTGWRPSCECGGEPVPCVVLDPFGGSGTTAGVANALGRRAILCELNEQYAEMIPRRVTAVVEAMTRKKKTKRVKYHKSQLSLFGDK